MTTMPTHAVWHDGTDMNAATHIGKGTTTDVSTAGMDGVRSMTHGIIAHGITTHGIMTHGIMILGITIITIIIGAATIITAMEEGTCIGATEARPPATAAATSWA